MIKLEGCYPYCGTCDVNGCKMETDQDGFIVCVDCKWPIRVKT
jgi:hypothetical protein